MLTNHIGVSFLLNWVLSNLIILFVVWLESDVCCRLQVALSGESYEGKRRPGRKQRQTTAE